MKQIIGLFVLFFGFSGFLLADSNAEISTNSAFILEGAGFAVTEEEIKTSEIDLAISTQQRSGSSIRATLEDGFITLDSDDLLATNLTTTLLREGKYMRINGVAESPEGNEASISFFGRLIEESKDASVYGFTGRISVDNKSYKIIYTAKISELAPVVTTTSSDPSNKQLTIYISKGSSNQGLLSSYIDSSRANAAAIQGTDTLRLRYFSMDRISVEPGTSVTFVNNDLVSHRIVSGTGLGSHSSVLSGAVKICTEITTDIPKGFNMIPPGSDARGCDFIYDGKIRTGEIAPGASATVTFKDNGFYRLIDPDYPWIRIDGYVFENINNLVLGQGRNLGN